MGHELGHHLYNHHDLPIGYVLRGKTPPSPKLALALTSWSRFAEVSADRAGAYCANDLETVAHSLFKLASGLSGQLVNFSLADFMRQVDEMQIEDAEPDQGAPTEDWFLTHPFSPLRVKALKLFDESVLAREDGISVTDLEAAVHNLMSLMEPSYLEGRTDTAEIMRRLLFAGAIAVASESKEITEAEIDMFEAFFGKRSFSDRLDVEQIKAELPERISLICQLSCAQLISARRKQHVGYLLCQGVFVTLQLCPVVVLTIANDELDLILGVAVVDISPKIPAHLA